MCLTCVPKLVINDWVNNWREVAWLHDDASWCHQSGDGSLPAIMIYVCLLDSVFSVTVVVIRLLLLHDNRLSD